MFRCQEFWELLHGPVILKLDSGPDHIVASYDSILKTEALAEMVLIIMSGLPNAPSIQQEMDVLYGAFKSATYDRSEMVLIEKIRKIGVAIRNGNARVAVAAAASLTLWFGRLGNNCEWKCRRRQLTATRLFKHETRFRASYLYSN